MQTQPPPVALAFRHLNRIEAQPSLTLPHYLNLLSIPHSQAQVNETLNACPLDAPSCISTLSDDEEHFAAPWQFDGTREEAIEQLISIATGARFDMGLIDSFGGVRQTDAAAYIAKGVLAVVSGGDMPEQPKRQRKSSTEFVPFDGDVTERRTTPGGAEYVRIVLGTGGGGATQASNLSEVIDCEFLFLPGGCCGWLLLQLLAAVGTVVGGGCCDWASCWLLVGCFERW